MTDFDTRRRVPLAAALGRQCGMKTDTESKGKGNKTKHKELPNKRFNPTRTSGGFSACEGLRLR